MNISLINVIDRDGNPLAYIDPDGREIVAVYDGISYTYRREGDEYAFYDRDGNSYMGDDPFMTSLTSALKEIGKGNHGSALLDYLANHLNHLIISQVTEDMGNGIEFDSYSGKIYWSTDNFNGGYCIKLKTKSVAMQKRPITIG